MSDNLSRMIRDAGTTKELAEHVASRIKTKYIAPLQNQLKDIQFRLALAEKAAEVNGTTAQTYKKRNEKLREAGSAAIAAIDHAHRYGYFVSESAAAEVECYINGYNGSDHRATLKADKGGRE